MDKELADELVELNVLLRKSIAVQERTIQTMHGNAALLAAISAAAFGATINIWKPSEATLATAAAVVCVALAVYKVIRSIAG